MKDSIITLTNEGLQIPVNEQSSVLKVLLDNKIEIDHSCGGFGTCGTCRIYVRSDLKQLDVRNEIEQERADDLKFEEHERLACQLHPKNGLAIEIPD